MLVERWRRKFVLVNRLSTYHMMYCALDVQYSPRLHQTLLITIVSSTSLLQFILNQMQDLLTNRPFPTTQGSCLLYRTSFPILPFTTALTPSLSNLPCAT